MIEAPGDQLGGDLKTTIPQDPTTRLGWEVSPDEWWSFVPEYYPERFVQTKQRDLNRNGRGAQGENISLKVIKNREFHAKGILLANEIPVFQKLLDYDKVVDLISPLTPHGGMEVEIKSAELGKHRGWDPVERQQQFEYTLDFVSTGRDEQGASHNAIVSEIIRSRQPPETGPSPYQ